MSGIKRGQRWQARADAKLVVSIAAVNSRQVCIDFDGEYLEIVYRPAFVTKWALLPDQQ